MIWCFRMLTYYSCVLYFVVAYVFNVNKKFIWQIKLVKCNNMACVCVLSSNLTILCQTMFCNTFCLKSLMFLLCDSVLEIQSWK